MKSVPEILESEIQVQFVRSSGPGGQKVNKSSTKAVLHWKYMESSALSKRDKDRFFELFETRINDSDEAVIQCDSTRHQKRNLEEAFSRLCEMVRMAKARPKKRKPTRPTKASQRKRVDQKKQRSDIKKNRKKVSY